MIANAKVVVKIIFIWVLKMKKRVLGLDLGIGSLGWAVVDLDEELLDGKENEAKYRIKNGKIVASGVRVFDEPVDRSGKSLLADRGEKRRTRATIERKAERLRYLIKLAKEYGIISKDFNFNEVFSAPKEQNTTKKATCWKDKDWDIWRLRKRSIYEKLQKKEIFRILYHIANHRGFYFPTKAEEKEILEPSKENKTSEDKKVKFGIATIRNEFKESGCTTIGEYIFNKEGKKHNHKDDYGISLYRTELIDEVNKIFEFQRGQGNTILSKEFEERYIKEVLMYTHPLNDTNIKKMIGECELLRGELRFPKHGYEAELFTFYNRVNNLKIKNREDLKDDERKKILDFALNKKVKVSFSDLRQLLKLDVCQRFNLCSYREFNPEYEKSITIEKDKLEEFNDEKLNLYDTNTGEYQYSCWEELKAKANEYFNKYVNAKKIKYYFSDVRKQLSISENSRFEIIKKDYCLSEAEIGIDKYLAQFEKEIFVEFSGYHMLKKGLGSFFNDIKDKLNDIAEALVYYQTDEMRVSYLKDKGIDNEEIINKILELNMKEVTHFSRKALSELNFKMSNGMLFNDAKNELGYGDIAVEKTTLIEPYTGSFKNNATVSRIIAEFRKTVNAINKTYGVIDEIHIELATDVANSKDKIARIYNGQIRYKEQRDAAKERCIANSINPDEGDNLLRFRLAEEQDFKCIYTGKGISLENSVNTSTDQISIFDCDIDHIIPISRSFNDSLQNKVLCSNLANREKANRTPYEYFDKVKTKEEWQKFKVRVLSGNKMSSAKKRNLLRESFTEEDMKNFISRDLNNTRYATRHIAEYLRKYFSFEQSQNNTILDVNRIRVLGGGITAKLRHMWGLDKNRNENNKHHAQDAIVIACASFGHIYYICSVLKQFEEKGIHSNKEDLVPWVGFREQVLESLEKVTVSKMVRCSATGQAHKQPNKKKKGYELITRSAAQNTIDVQLDSMFRYDIYHGVEGYYCVPIYAIDLHKKNFKHIIQPVGKDGIEKEAVADDFVFSLYKGSYIKILTMEKEEFTGYVKQYDSGTGQIFVESINGSREYEINTSTLEVGDYIRVQIDDEEIIEAQIVEYDNEKSVLRSITSSGKYNVIEAKEKLDKKGKTTKKYITTKPYIKINKEKKVNISVIEKLQKFTIDRLGNLTKINKEKERFSQKIKPERQRREDRAKRKQQKG